MSNHSGPDLVTSARKINKVGSFVLLVAAALAMLLLPALVPSSSSGPLTLVSPVVAHADGVGHSLVVYHQPNDSGQALILCHNWSGTSDTRSDCPSATVNLGQGKWSDRDPINWSDTDGVRIPKGYSLKISQTGPDGILFQNCSGSTKYKKTSPWVVNGSKWYHLYLKKNVTGLGGC